MRITKIKLAGFKSFADPTTLTLPGNLTAIVGPNGCGKSNIIDAMMWVMGESSAKHLRGDSMADVIFNGSNSRKPVGQASVEIVFDNSDGKLGGQYAGYSEIALKRTVSRDGISSYFLNGTRCRRKDIQNVFLGTGLGVRGSYSVIEQGMISRVIEAKPEELRSFLEEAAGISKYKERRRETENRIRRTNENIDRLNDIREELEKQLNHLQRQAKGAERYQKLKQQERLMEAQLLALRWRVIDREREAHRAVIARRANTVEQIMVELRRIEASQAQSREAQTRAIDHFNGVQSDFYSKSAEISRLEQILKHSQERRDSLQQDLDDARRSLAQAMRLLDEDCVKLSTLEDANEELQPELARKQQSEQRAAEVLQDMERAAQTSQSEWDAFNQRLAETVRNEHVAQVRLEHLENTYTASCDRLSVLTREHDELQATTVELAVAEAHEQLTECERKRDGLRTIRDSLRNDLHGARQHSQSLSERLHQERSRLETIRGKLASVRALQEAALGRDEGRRNGWLQRNGLDSYPLLAEEITIEAGWEKAAEAALWTRLGALCGESLVGGLLNAGNLDAPTESVMVVGPVDGPGPAGTACERTMLLDKISTPWSLGSLLAGVYIAADRREAETMRGALGPHESVITPDGTWVGPNWAQLTGAGGQQSGIFERERLLGDLGEQVDALEKTVENLEADHEASRRSLHALETREYELGQDLQVAADAATQAKAMLERREGEFERNTERAAAIESELDDLRRLSQESVAAIETGKAALTQMKDQLARFDHEGARLTKAKGEFQEQLLAARTAWREERERSHEIALKLESMRSNRQSAASAIERNKQLKDGLAGRCADLESAIISAETPQQDTRIKLEQALVSRVELESALGDARKKLEEFDAAMRSNEQDRTNTENEITERRDELEQARLEERALEVRINEIEDRLGETDHELKTLVHELPQDATEESRREQLEKIRSGIQRLGPINLAAIDEFTQLSERKQYLDQQLDDLTKALETLQGAIHKIDRETRTRFRATFDKVNNGLQTMFPILFGGGHAYLELIGDDLLETGVTVMARPPGKRNSTIHLLSGGEKALTAVAFIFAIFELNPAPFCLLDEVDAPLDDANVVRLSEMILSMSQRTQFVCITHNKITMEIAAQLIGVTMEEAGVSRLVSVNMEEAVEMAASG